MVSAAKQTAQIAVNPYREPARRYCSIDSDSATWERPSRTWFDVDTGGDLAFRRRAPALSIWAVSTRFRPRSTVDLTGVAQAEGTVEPD
jgi:hypothetical protein